MIAQLTQNTTLSCPCHSVRSPSEGPRQQTAGYCRQIRGPLRLAADFLVLCVCRQTNHGDGCDVLQACSQNMDWMMDGERGGGRDQPSSLCRGLFGEARLRPDDDVDLRENTSAGRDFAAAARSRSEVQINLKITLLWLCGAKHIIQPKAFIYFSFCVLLRFG